MERERPYTIGSHLTRVLHTARINNVDIVLCGERMKDGRFYCKLGETNVKMNSSACHGRGTKKE